MPVRHVVKFDHEDGKELKKPILWCGAIYRYPSFTFLDAQHVALSAGGSIAPCKKCIKAIIRELEKEL